MSWVARGTAVRRLVHEAFGCRPTILPVTVRRYRGGKCRHMSYQDTTRTTEPSSKLTRDALRWLLTAIVVQHLTVARVAEGLLVNGAA